MEELTFVLVKRRDVFHRLSRSGMDCKERPNLLRIGWYHWDVSLSSKVVGVGVANDDNLLGIAGSKVGILFGTLSFSKL